ncbi:MAG: hypothetical protein Q6L60_13700 [Thermostichus sp. HHBFW_bins_43]
MQLLSREGRSTLSFNARYSLLIAMAPMNQRLIGNVINDPCELLEDFVDSIELSLDLPFLLRLLKLNHMEAHFDGCQSVFGQILQHFSNLCDSPLSHLSLPLAQQPEENAMNNANPYRTDGSGQPKWDPILIGNHTDQENEQQTHTGQNQLNVV